MSNWTQNHSKKMAEAYLNSKNPATAISSSNSSKKKKSEAKGIYEVEETKCNTNSCSSISFHKLQFFTVKPTEILSPVVYYLCCCFKCYLKFINTYATIRERNLQPRHCNSSTGCKCDLKENFFIGGQKYVILGERMVL